MKAILNIVVCCAAAVGGTFASTTLKAKSSAPAEVHSKSNDTGHEKTDKHSKSKDKGHDKSASKSSDSFEFLKFKRQFVVPVVNEDRVGALVLLNIGISLSGDVKDELYQLEPKFRDAFMRELLGMSNSGYFNDELTDPQTYEILRETLLRAAKEIEKDGVKDILILDFARQDR
jgi:hypothetical protein